LDGLWQQRTFSLAFSYNVFSRLCCWLHCRRRGFLTQCTVVFCGWKRVSSINKVHKLNEPALSNPSSGAAYRRAAHCTGCLLRSAISSGVRCESRKRNGSIVTWSSDFILMAKAGRTLVSCWRGWVRQIYPLMEAPL
jgi:hypothetical protein